MQIVPISDHVVVAIEKDSIATLTLVKENEIVVKKENVNCNFNCNCNCRHLEGKISMCCWLTLIVGIIFVVTFFIIGGRFNESSQHYPPPQPN